QLGWNHTKCRACNSIVESDNDLILLDLASFPDEDLPYDAATRMLHLLDVRFRHDATNREHRARDVAGHGPTADDPQQQRNGSESDEVELTDHLARILLGAHPPSLPAFVSAATRKLRSAGAD